METKNKDMISDELFAAFNEGRTDSEETIKVLNALSVDENLQEELILSQRLDALMAVNNEGVDVIPINAVAAESTGNLCDLQCEEYVLNSRGIEYDADDLSQEAKLNYWLSDKGTPLHSVGRLLEKRDLIVIRQFGAEIVDIQRAINACHDVIVVLNNSKLTGKGNGQVSYHAVVVTEITENTINLYDPASDTKNVSFDRKIFESAWKDAKSYLVRVKSKDYDYNPHPIDLDNVDLDSSLIDLRESIAENAHEVWADKRQEEGWTYGKERSDQTKQNPDMVPYSMLSESEKEYDRRMAIDTIKLMRKLGYDIIKKEDSVVHRSLVNRLNNIDSSRFCRCGYQVFPDDIFCPRCGVRINWKTFL